MKKPSLILSLLALFALGVAISIATYYALSAYRTPGVTTKATSSTATPIDPTEQLLKENVAKNTSGLSPYENLKIEEFKALLPYTTESFEATYSTDLNQIVIAVKNSETGYEDVQNYLKDRNLLDLYQSGSNIFLVRESSDSTRIIQDTKTQLKTILQSQAQQESVKGIFDARAQAAAQTEIDPEEPYLPDQGDIVQVADFIKNLASFGEADEELEPSENQSDEEEAPAGPPSVPGAPNAPVAESEIVLVKGVKVHRSIEAQVEALLTAADNELGNGILRGGGWRSSADQIRLRIAHCGGNTQYNVYQKPARECRPPTARPGLSNHERGLAIDFSCNGRTIPNTSTAGGRKTSPNNTCWRWLEANAREYGLYPLSSEAWHWSINGN